MFARPLFAPTAPGAPTQRPRAWRRAAPRLAAPARWPVTAALLAGCCLMLPARALSALGADPCARPATGGELGLMQALRLANELQPELSAATARVAWRAAELAQADAAWWPELSSPVVVEHVHTDTAQTDAARGGLELRWTLFDGGARAARRRAAAAEWRGARDALAALQQQIYARIAARYVGAVEARAALTCAASVRMCSTTTGLLSSGHQAASACARSAARHATRAAAALSSACRQSACRSACIKPSSPAGDKAQGSSRSAPSADVAGSRQQVANTVNVKRSGGVNHGRRDAHNRRSCGAPGIAARVYRCASMLFACIDARPVVALFFARARKTFRSIREPPGPSTVTSPKCR